jgi:hypothetical protein
VPVPMEDIRAVLLQAFPTLDVTVASEAVMVPAAPAAADDDHRPSHRDVRADTNANTDLVAGDIEGRIVARQHRYEQLHTCENNTDSCSPESALPALTPLPSLHHSPPK